MFPSVGKFAGYSPSAKSPITGIMPITKSSMILNIIFDLTLAGNPPSTCWQVRRTIIAMNASRTSPALLRSQWEIILLLERQNTNPGMMPITLLQPNLIPAKEKRLISKRYARRLTFVRTLPSCSEIPGGKALGRFFVFFDEGLPSRRVAGTVSKQGSCREKL